MPNHITNELTASPSVLDFMRSEESEFDFNRIAPMPEILRKNEPSCAVKDWAMLATGKTSVRELSRPTPDPLQAFKAGNFGAATERLHQANLIRLLTEGPFPKDFSDEDWESFLLCLSAIRTCGGIPSWYEWAIENWGTKWNAYEVSRKSERVVVFQTAWSMPGKIIQALSDKFQPGEPMRIRWADEDFGYNVGIFTITSDSVEGGPLENNSKEAKELALELLYNGEIPDHMERTESGEIVYKDDEDDESKEK